MFSVRLIIVVKLICHLCQEKNALVTNKSKKSLEQLSILIGIPRKAWVQGLANWLQVNRTTVSTWCREGRGIPQKHIKNIEARGYPREQWYIEEEIIEELTLGDQASAEVIRGGVIVPEDPYKPKADQPLSLVGDRDARDRSDIDKHHVTALIEGDNTEYIDTLRYILKSGDEITKLAIKGNLTACANHIKTKDKVEDLEREVQRLRKSIASSPNPGKDGTDEA